MKKQDISSIFDRFSQNLVAILSESEGVKKQMQELVAENVRLRLENERLQELVNQSTGPVQPVSKPSQPTARLEKIYDDGHHICNDFFSQIREDGDCAFCMELLFGER